MNSMDARADRTALLDQLDTLLSRIVDVLTRGLSQMVRGRVSVPQFFVLRVLRDRGKSSISQVAANLQITPSAVTYLADGLVRGGLVERVRDENDRRVVWLEMTGKGLELVRDLEKRRRGEMQRITSPLSTDELEALVRILARLKR